VQVLDAANQNSLVLLDEVGSNGGVVLHWGQMQSKSKSSLQCASNHRHAATNHCSPVLMHISSLL